jgi:hypothetical protein
LCLSIIKIYSVFGVFPPEALNTNTTFCNDVHSISFQLQILGKPGIVFIHSRGKYHQLLKISWWFYSRDICYSDSHVPEDSSLLRCCTMMAVERLKPFQSFVVLFMFRVRLCSWQTAWLEDGGSMIIANLGAHKDTDSHPKEFIFITKTL